MKIRRRSLRRHLKHLFASVYHPLIACSLHLIFLIAGKFPLKFLRQIAPLFGHLAAIFATKSKRIALQNLKIAAPELSQTELKKIIPKIFSSGVLLFLEMAWAAYNPKQLKEVIRIPDNIRRQLTSQGCFAVTPHLGNWEILVQAAVAQDIPIAAIGKKLSNPHLSRLIQSIRTRNGLEIIDTHGAVRQFIKVLKQNKAVGILMDQALRPRNGGIFVQFFGIPATCSRAVAAMAIKLQTPIIVCACIRTPTGFEFISEELSKPVPEFTDDIELTQEIIRCNEKMIAAHLDEYSWLYPRWRYIPEDYPEELRHHFPDYANKSKYA